MEEPDGSVRVNLGTTKALTGEVGMLGTASANALTASGVTWTSSDPAVATVDQSGVVTAVDLGQAIITATKNGTVIETYTVNSTLADGVYVFEPTAGLHVMSVDEISIGSPELIALPYGDEDEVLSTYGKQWYLKHQDNSYYSIHPIYDLDMALYIFMGAFVGLTDPDTQTTNCWHWKIAPGSYGYVLLNRHHSTTAIAPSESDTDYSAIVPVTWDGTDINQNFSYYPAITPPCLMMFDKETGNLVGETSIAAGCQSNFDVRIGKTASLPMNDLDAKVKVITSNPSDQDFTVTFTNNNASYSSVTKRITGNTVGTVTGRVVKALGTQNHYIWFNLNVLPGSPLVVYYDSATFTSQYRAHFIAIMDFCHDVFWDEVGYYFGKDDTPTAYNSSLLAACPNGVTSQCDSTCGYSTSCRTTHHKNLGRLTAEISAGNTTSTFMYWRGDSPTVFCGSRGPDFEYDPMHVHTALDEGMQGVVYDNQNVAFFFKTPETVPEKIRANLALTAVHELAHTLGLREVYSNEYGDNSNHDVDGLACVMEAFEPGTYEKDFYDEIIKGNDSAFCNYCIGKLASEIQG